MNKPKSEYKSFFKKFSDFFKEFFLGSRRILLLIFDFSVLVRIFAPADMEAQVYADVPFCPMEACLCVSDFCGVRSGSGVLDSFP